MVEQNLLHKRVSCMCSVSNWLQAVLLYCAHLAKLFGQPVFGSSCLREYISPTSGRRVDIAYLINQYTV